MNSRAAILAGIFTTIAATAFAQDTLVWSDIDCSGSRIKSPAGLRCRATQEYSGGTGAFSNGNGKFRRWATFGTLNDIQLYYWLGEGIAGRSNFRETQSFDAVIRNLSPEGKGATGFSDLKHVGDADYMTFTGSKGQACLGIHKFGPVTGGGNAWILTATRCSPANRPATDADIARFAAETAYAK